MILETRRTGGCRTHLVVSERAREAVLVDPLLPNAEADLADLRARGLTLRWTVDTHTHADHLSAGAWFREKAGAGYLMHRSARSPAVSRRVDDGEELGLGELALRFLHVPGHTRDSLMIALPGLLLTGDFLFLGEDGAGRLDLPGADVDAHHDSLRRLDAFAAGAEVRPAHDYRGRDASTLGAERAANPVLSPRARDEYLRWWSERRLGPADWMGAVVAANAAGTTDPRAVAIPTGGNACAAAPAGGACSTAAPGPTAPTWTARELHERLGRDVTVIDVRERDEYEGELGRVPGARLIPLGELKARLAEVPRGPVAVVCHSGKRSARGASMLLASGRADVRSMEGGMLAWTAAGLPVERSARA